MDGPSAAAGVHPRVSPALRGRPGEVASYVAGLAQQPLLERQHLTRQEFRCRFGARREDIEQVRLFARNNGLHVVRVYRSRRIVELGGTIQAMSAAFGMNLALYHSPRGMVRGTKGWVHVPRRLAPVVQGVFGFDTRPQARPHFRILPGTRPLPSRNGSARGSSHPARAGPALQLPDRGEATARLSASSSSVAASGSRICSSTSLSSGSARCLRLSTSRSTGPRTPRRATRTRPTVRCSRHRGRRRIAPGAKIVVYFAPNTRRASSTRSKAAVHDTTNKPSIISISWGSPASRSGLSSRAGDEPGVPGGCCARDHRLRRRRRQRLR